MNLHESSGNLRREKSCYMNSLTKTREKDKFGFQSQFAFFFQLIVMVGYPACKYFLSSFNERNSCFVALSTRMLGRSAQFLANRLPSNLVINIFDSLRNCFSSIFNTLYL